MYKVQVDCGDDQWSTLESFELVRGCLEIAEMTARSLRTATGCPVRVVVSWYGIPDRVRLELP